MIDHERAKALVASLIDHGERIDPVDLSVLYGWIHSAMVALEPFGEERKRFHDSCWGSLGPPAAMLEAGLTVLVSVMKTAYVPWVLDEKSVSAGYLNLYNRVFSPHKGLEGDGDESLSPVAGPS
jgi:hypothetical protein